MNEVEFMAFRFWKLIYSIVGTTTLESRGFEFSKYLKKEGSDFSHKMEGLGKIGGIVLKNVDITYVHTN